MTSRSEHRVRFENGFAAQLMAIDGTWRRDCVLHEVSETDATLSLLASIEGLPLREFFLLLSSTGLAYRRCALEWVNGDQLGVTFAASQRKRRRNREEQVT